jgi:hypothetical protein
MPFLVYLLMTLLFPALSQGASDASLPLTILEQYAGGFKPEYGEELATVKRLMEVAATEIPPQLGYGPGFHHPVTVRFQDGAPADAENPYFFVRRSTSTDFQQDLIVNVEAFAEHTHDLTLRDRKLRAGFYYAMTVALLNDVSVGQGNSELPVWVAEGTAVYISGTGDELLRKTNELVDELNDPYPYLTKKQWASYDLAIQYISRGGVINLQNFIGNILEGKSTADAIMNVFGLPWETFEKNEKEYARKFLAPGSVPPSP